MTHRPKGSERSMHQCRGVSWSLHLSDMRRQGMARTPIVFTEIPRLSLTNPGKISDLRAHGFLGAMSITVVIQLLAALPDVFFAGSQAILVPQLGLTT